MLEGIYGIVQLFHEAVFVADIFDVKKLLECDHLRMPFSLYANLIPLTGESIIED